MESPVLKLSRGASLKPRKFLRRDKKTRLPIPHVNILVRKSSPCRLLDHYYDTLQDDLMYMTYVHETNRRPPRKIRLKYDPEDPYTKFRHNPPVGGSKVGTKPAPPTTADNVVRLEKISLHTMQKQAIANRNHLLGAVMTFRALSGITQGGGGWQSSEGVQIVRGRKSIGGWIRPGIPVGVKVDLKGERMYDFINALVQFVLPRMKEFSGVPLPLPSANMNTPHGVSGVISMGLPPEAVAFFPQIEVNQDAYPNMYGMHIHFITSAVGIGAHHKARALLSGFQLPFARR